VSKKVIQTGVTTTTDYLSGFQYKKKTASEPVELQFFMHAEGYVNVSKSDLKEVSAAFNYVFNYTDHLGNIRLSYSQDPSNSTLKIIEENHYYPFGLKHTGYNSDKMMYVKEGSVLKIKPKPPLFKTSYNYRYNSKEWQDELGLNMYDYGARNYDPALGRWMNIDPLAEKFPNMSPYNFCMNNPIYFIDPDGREVQKPPLKGTKEFNSFVKDIVNKNSGPVNWSDRDGTWSYNAKSQKWVGIGESKGNDINFTPNLIDKISSKVESINKSMQAEDPHKYEGASGLREVATGMQDWGDGAALTGYGLTVSVVGAEIGVPLAAVGNVVSTIGSAIEIGLDFDENNTGKAWLNLAIEGSAEIITHKIDKIPGVENATKEILKQNVNLKSNAIPRIIEANEKKENK
jgi:RHS repeat-associated protein